jgi:hypothetical protein
MIDLERRDSLKNYSAKPPQAPKSNMHEVEFLYKRVTELQKAMDEVLRLPYINEAEVRDIFSKVYKSAATQVSIKQL